MNAITAVWTNGQRKWQTIAVGAIAAMAFVGMARSPHGHAAEKSAHVPAGKQEAHASVNVDALRFIANGRPVSSMTSEVAGFVLMAEGEGPQVAALAHAGALVACVRQDETAESRLPLPKWAGTNEVSVDVDLLAGETAQVEMAVEGNRVARTLHAGQGVRLGIDGVTSRGGSSLSLIARGSGAEAAVRWREIRIHSGADSTLIALVVQPKKVSCPPPRHPPLRPAMEQVLIEWDWRMQDGIGTPRDSVTFAAAIRQMFGRGDLLIQDLRAAGCRMPAETAEWERLRKRSERLTDAVGQTALLAGSQASKVACPTAAGEGAWEQLWRELHQLRRRIAMKNPLAQTGPVVFAQDVPGGAYSSHIVSFHGDSARPGGGVFVLEEPGRSMRVRPLVRDQLPQGAYMHPEVSYDGRRVLFAFAKVDSDPTSYGQFPNRFFHLYSVDADGRNLKQLTDGPYDDHSPCSLPNGKIVFCSTRRGGFHRCGKGPCPTHTLALCDADGNNVQVISYHETHEYDPAVLHDGRVLYTRWDYVDRRAVNFQHLWTVKPDGSDVRIYYGNATLNPMGIWEALPIPGSKRIMGIGCAHHAMPAGSIVVVDVSKGIDDLAPITRFTPDVPFYESEFPVQSRWGGQWPPEVQQRLSTIRWPGHCYRSPYPLSEKYCLAAYTFDTLQGEPYFNLPHLFGLYLVDCFGNKELLYRDLNISSSWPVPLREREKPPVLPSALAADARDEGTFLVRNVYDSWAPLGEARITRLRIIQVLPKTTPDMGAPPPGAARGAPGKQVLGTVPVERDGSAWFRVPARKAVMFQALDERGRAVQTMYSLTYVQPGEQAACVGCHEHGMKTPPASSSNPVAMALGRPPSTITPGPDGSNPFSYPLLVQPVMDRHCTRCHKADAPKEKSGGVILTGEPESQFSRSYNALVRRVPFRDSDGPPRTRPDQYGARGSKLTGLLLKGHYEVTLTAEEWERLFTWMDTNALFYGTFNPQDQARQLRGERIRGPELE